MTIPSRSILLIPVGLLVLGFIWFGWFRVAITPDEEYIYTILITKSHSQTTGTNSSNSTLPILNRLWSMLTPPIEASWVLLYHYPYGKFYLFEIDNHTSIKTSSGTKDLYRSINENIFFLKKSLAEFYGITQIDFEITINETDSLKFLDNWGGGFFFNLYSTNYSLGETYINYANYEKFLSGINDVYLRKLTAQSFWFNLLMTFEDNLPHQKYSYIFLQQFYDSFSANFNYPTFATLIAPLLKPLPDKKRWVEENTELRFKKNNLESVGAEFNNVLVPYQNGTYDREKIKNEITRMREKLSGEEDLNVTVQIKNATPVNFLAARAAGFFRLHGINISEYLRFSKILPHSVILDYANNAHKRDYIKKITRIDRIYHLFNYRENFDLSVYLGENLYLLNQTNNIAETNDISAESINSTNSTK